MRAIIYARLSPTPRGEESKGGNLTQQVELSQALCDRKGWSVVAVIVEKDTSASTKRGAKRSDEWERVEALVEDGKADAIVSRHYDRMYRAPWDLEDLVDLAEATGGTGAPLPFWNRWEGRTRQAASERGDTRSSSLARATALRVLWSDSGLPSLPSRAASRQGSKPACPCLSAHPMAAKCTR